MYFLSVLYLVTIFLIGIIITTRASKKSRTNILLWSYLLHMFMSYYFYYYALSHSADANMYYSMAKYNGEDWYRQFNTGTDFIIFVATFFVKYLHFSKLNLFFLFGLFGFIGIVYFIKLIPKNNYRIHNIPLINIILLFPSLHFWTAALGKDSLFFMALMMFLYAFKELKKHFLLLVFSFFLIFLIRPHMGFVLLASLFLVNALKSPERYKISNVFILILSIVGFVITFPFLKHFLSVKEIDYNVISQRLNQFNNYGAQNVGAESSYIDVSSYPLPLKMFSYLFRPLFFDAHSFLTLFASVENFFLLVFFYILLKLTKLKFVWLYKKNSTFVQLLLIYFLSGWIILSAGMYNLGLAARQKMMLLPVLFIIFFYILNLRYSKTNNMTVNKIKNKINS